MNPDESGDQRDPRRLSTDELIVTDVATTTGQAQDARHTTLSQVDKLRRDAESAAQVRALTTHPDVVALRVEKVRAQVDALIWVGIALGLGFTMVNVQTFAAAGAAAFTLPWLAAWVLDPMVSLVLIAVLRAEQITARYQVPGMDGWVRVTKVFAFAATYVMNTWASWHALDPSGIVLHSVPPVLVYCAAEAGPILRDRLTEAVLRAARLTSLATPTAEQTADRGAEQAASPSATPEPATTTPTTPTTGSASVAAAVDPLADTVELPVIPTSPAPRARAPRTRSTRSAKPGKRGKTTKPPARSMADLRTELDAAITSGAVDPEPSAEQIRKALRISPDRARALRDERRTPPPAPVDITTQPRHDSPTDDHDQHTEVTRSAA
jgi:hypothetical protein